MNQTFRSRIRRIPSVLLAGILGVALGVLLPPPALASTNTFANTAAIEGGAAFGLGVNTVPITVAASGTPTGSVYPSTLQISGAVGNLASLTVKLWLNHTAPDDLDVLLVSPSGRAVVLMSDAGGFADYDGQLTFDTAAIGGLTNLPDTSTFSNVVYDATNYVGNDGPGEVWPSPAPVVADPNASMTSLIGDSPNGDWKLFVHDDQDQDGGAITSWGISIGTDSVPTSAETYPSGVAVSGLVGEISDVDLTLSGVSWRNINTLDVMLVAPDGRKALVLSDVGGYNPVDGVTLTLDDEAGTSLPDLTAPPSGSYRPTNVGGGDSFPAPAPDPSTAGTPLSVFDGADPNGTWRLYIVQDEIDIAQGFISAGWSLQITTTRAEPQITTTTPAAHATGARRNADIRATASKALSPGSVTGKTVYLTRAGSRRHIAATVSYLDSSHTIVIDPRRRLEAGTRYRAVITNNVHDTAGHRLDQDPTRAGDQQKSWRFRTK